MAALTRLGCFIVCPHVCGDCNLIVPPVGVGPVASGRTLHREKRTLQNESKAPNGQPPVCADSGHLVDRVELRAYHV